MVKVAIVNSSQMAKYNRMDAGFFVMSDEIKEDVKRLEKQFDRQSLIKILMSFPDEIKNLLKKILACRIGINQKVKSKLFLGYGLRK